MKSIYLSAKKFLIARIPSKEAKLILNSYIDRPAQNFAPVELNVLFRGLLSSAQNSNMKSGVIGGSIGGVDNLRKALFGFNPNKVLKKFRNNPERLLEYIVSTVHPNGLIRTTNRSLWPQYCKTILSAATFFSQFSDGKDFYKWANSLYLNKLSMPALPMILSAEIKGIGYTLACDFLKELGFIEYGKPDKHVKTIFVGLGLCDPNPSPYDVQKVIAKIAAAANVSPYNVDKVFWLIGSGKLYRTEHKHLGNDGHIGRMGNDFLAEFGMTR